MEKADDWQRFGDPWSKRRDDKAVIVSFNDQKVLAVPYDMPVMGYKTEHISTLRLWQSEAIEEFDFNLFNDQEYALAVREKNLGRGYHASTLSQTTVHTQANVSG